MVDGINNIFKTGQKIELKDRGAKGSGITFELKSVFDELTKQGIIKDKDGKGLTKQDALNLYNTLNKIHQDTNRATNYTTMQVGQSFDYSAEELKAMAEAAGYEIVAQGEEGAPANPDALDPSKDEPAGLPTETSISDEPLDKPQGNQRAQTEAMIDKLGGKIIERSVNGQKQDIAVVEIDGQTVRREINEDGTLGDNLAATKTFGKNEYITGDFKSIGLKEYVMRRLKGNYTVKEFWANRNITFSLEEGDMLGIIGTNGAGKSTLLKAVSGIMRPSEGTIVRHGTIAALLELGSGFDGDLTVKENAYLRGAMLGYTRKFMDETYEQIIDFAELKEFEDRPFKQLSSGMKSRLAFSIASMVRPDILILDEVLSVGDGAFRKKSEAKMKEIINGGATTILVSHSLNQVRSMCSKILWLHKGKQITFGSDVQKICDDYQSFLDGKLKI